MNVNVLGTQVFRATQAESLKLLDELIEKNERQYVCFCEAHLCVQGIEDPMVRRALDAAAYVFPDGISMTLGAKMLGNPLPERITGPDTMLAFMRHGVAKGYRHFLFGGGGGVAEKLKQTLESKVPGVQIVGTNTPPFRELGDEGFASLKTEIVTKNPHVMWVALGAPKQEIWMAEYSQKLNIPLMLGVGAAFDFHAGMRRRAPKWIRAIGMEWLYRMFTGGRRVFLRNLRYESAFVFYLLRGIVTQRMSR